MARPLRLLLPCAGVDAPSHAFEHLGVDVEVAALFEKNPKHTEAALRHYHGSDPDIVRVGMEGGWGHRDRCRKRRPRTA